MAYGYPVSYFFVCDVFCLFVCFPFQGLSLEFRLCSIFSVLFVFLRLLSFLFYLFLCLLFCALLFRVVGVELAPQSCLGRRGVYGGHSALCDGVCPCVVGRLLVHVDSCLVCLPLSRYPHSSKGGALAIRLGCEAFETF